MKIISQLPNKNVHLMGDYNINLFNLKLRPEQKFEELIISLGFCPLITIATHKRPNCMETCIEYILK